MANYLAQNSINNISALINSSDLGIFTMLANQDISLNTKKAISSDLNHFLKWYQETNGESFSFSRLTTRDISNYKTYCKEQLHLSANTINRRLVTIRNICKMAVNAGTINKNPAEQVKQLSLQPLAPKGLTQPELRALLKEVEVRGSIRDKLIVELMCGGGLRVCELVNLKRDAIFLSERKGHIIVMHSKGEKTRTVPLNANLREILKAYIEKHSPADRLFIGQRGPLTTIAINKIVDVYAKKAGIKCTPHRLRHTFAYNYLLHQKGDLVGLAQILGHSSLNTTAIYTQHRLEDLQEKIEKVIY